MAYSQVATYSYNGQSGDSSAGPGYFTYFFDTFLNGRSDFSVSAHPDSSAFKRLVTKTMANNIITGSPFIEYYWVTWSSATSTTNCTWYPNMLYTTTPGDSGSGTYTGTALGNQFLSSGSNYGQSSANLIRFWASDVNNGFIVTRGKHIQFCHLGADNGFMFEDDTFDGVNTASVKRSLFRPILNNSAYWKGLPANNNLTGSITVSIGPYGAGEWVTSNTDFIIRNGPIHSPGSSGYKGVLCDTTASDIGYHYAIGNTGGLDLMGSAGSGPGLLMYDGTNYWLRASDDLAQPSACFDMGTSEPVLT